MPRRAALLQIEMINRNNLFRNNNNDVRYPLIHMRDHLFHAAFVRLALIYAKIFSERERKIIEFLLLTLSCLALVLLSYIHMAFVQTPTDCLAHVENEWPRDGILRVEILKEKLNGKYTLEKSYLREKKIKELEYIDLPNFYSSNGISDDDEDYKSLIELSDALVKSQNSSNSETFTNSSSSFNRTIDEELNSIAGDNSALPTLAWTDDEYIMEFSLEYGFLKLSPSVRKQYNISVELVTLNPSTDKCFGGALNNLILYNFLGYDEVLLASLKLLASKEDYKGYVRNVLTDVEFIFVNAWMDKKSYITAGFVMMVFTISISILLRYSHHQIFVFIGMEAIMSEFFNDTAIAFYVILIVWMADQFDTICCKSVFTKKHWLRFFYLYHFFFYAYSYRFGHNRFLALLTSWLFTLHSMVYFFHRYELPTLVARHSPRNNNQVDPPENTPTRNNTDAPDPPSEGSSVSGSDRTEVTNTSSNMPNTNAADNSNEESNLLQSTSSQPNVFVSRNRQDIFCRNQECYEVKGNRDFHSEPNEKEVREYNKNVKTMSEIIYVLKKNIQCMFSMNLIRYLVICVAIIVLSRNLCTNLYLNNIFKILYSGELFNGLQSNL